jgi:hypothetical protein
LQDDLFPSNSINYQNLKPDIMLHIKIISFLICALTLNSFDTMHAQSYNNSQQGSSSKGYQPLYSSDGRLVAQIPLPAGWQVAGPVGSDQVFMTGPGGVKVSGSSSRQFFYSNDPSMMQLFQSQNKQVSPFIPLQQILDTHIKPQIQSQGGKLLKNYHHPELERRQTHVFQNIMSVYGVQHAQAFIMVTEWASPDGKSKSLIMLIQRFVQSNAVNSHWSLAMDELEAPAHLFDQAKETFLRAMVNLHYDLEADRATAKQAKRQSDASIARNERMYQYKSPLVAPQQSGSSPSVLDISMEGYKKRNGMIDQGHQNTINGIREENTVSNPYSGQSMQVQQGYKRTFVDPYGNYYQTDDPFFNPAQVERYRHYREVKQ